MHPSSVVAGCRPHLDLDEPSKNLRCAPPRVREGRTCETAICAPFARPLEFRFRPDLCKNHAKDWSNVSRQYANGEADHVLLALKAFALADDE